MDVGEQIVREALTRLSAFVHARDLAFVEEFDPGFCILAGSESGELAMSRPGIKTLLNGSLRAARPA